MLATRHSLLGQERPPAEDRCTEQTKVVGRHFAGGQLLWNAATREVDDVVAKSRHVLHDMCLRTPVLILRRRCAAPRPLREGVHEHDEAIGIRKGHRLQQDGVDHREDRRIGADADRKRQDRHDREPGSLHECSDGVTKILNELVHA